MWIIPHIYNKVHLTMTDQEIKKYVINTIRTGDKKRIQAVLARYQEYIKERNTEFYRKLREQKKTAYDNALEVFDIKE